MEFLELAQTKRKPAFEVHVQSGRQNLNILLGQLPEEIILFIQQRLEIDETVKFAVLDKELGMDFFSSDRWTEETDWDLDFLASYQRVNDIRYVNKFLEQINKKLKKGGHVFGLVETSAHRYEQLEKQYIYPLNHVFIAFDYIIKRVWPKLPYLKKLYFNLTKGRNRIISEMEMYGRLYSCGFELLDSIQFDEKLYFLATKVKRPEFNMEATYGPFISLRRVGKGGRILRVYKLRTMYPYSEYIQGYVYERCGLQEGGKIKKDPRVNHLGSILRKYWLDELPMLINLLRGDLKIVGVRPLSKHYLSLYPEKFRRYRNGFKPGLIPPFYADLPKTHEEIIKSEYRYLKAYEKKPLYTDLYYLFKAFCNIVFRNVRSH